ncbi:MAG TPA: hypothetical protein V6C93_18665 [Allocoleopsis sp.]
MTLPVVYSVFQPLHYRQRHQLLCDLEVGGNTLPIVQVFQSIYQLEERSHLIVFVHLARSHFIFSSDVDALASFFQYIHRIAQQKITPLF